MTAPHHEPQTVDELADMQVKEALTSGIRATKKELLEKTGLGDRILRRSVERLVAKGELIVGIGYMPGIRGAVPRTYRLAQPSAPIVRTAAMLGDAR